MLFNSLHYIIFLPIVVVFYYILPHRWRWLFLLAASYYFYMSWIPVYAVLLLVSTSIAYICAIRVNSSQELAKKRAYLWFGISSLLCILFIFKYYNFINDSFLDLLGLFQLSHTIPHLNVILPIGISFYTFQKISYIVDVYHGKAKTEEHFGVFALYSCFFPQLVAGPIERASHLLPQLREKHSFSYAGAVSGLQLILWGYFKKITADRLAILVQGVYGDPTNYSGIPLIVATLFFSIQIYLDFSGYTDIAIGSARLLGFDLVQNFRQPYFSKSFREFWQRWNMSLSFWFRDYLYIPLGGNRVGKGHWYLNIMATFMISGLWHGASWTFVIWGALHGLFICAERILGQIGSIIRSQVNRRGPEKIYSALRWIGTFCMVNVAWIFFRANSVSDAWYIINKIVTGTGYPDMGSLMVSFRGMGMNASDLIIDGILILLVLIYDAIDSRGNFWKVIDRRPVYIRWGVYYAMIVLILFYAPFNKAQNFIYFQF